MSETAIKKNEKLRDEKVSRLVSSFFVTTLIALIFNALYNITDALFVSWGVGDNAMGGVSIVFPFVIIQGAISTAIGGGAASLVSRKIGEGRLKDAGEITLNAMAVFYISAVMVTVIGFATLNPFLKLMGATSEIEKHAKDYYIIILAGNIFSTGFSSIIRAEGKMKYALLIWVIPITVNIILDAVFILVLGMGVKGSALATVIGQFISFSMSILFFCKFTTLDFKGTKLKLKRIGSILAIGLPSLAQMGSLSVMTLLMNNFLKTESGTFGVNAFAYMSKIITFAIIPFTALSQALMPIVGFNYGDGKSERVKKTVSLCMIYNFSYAVIAVIFALTIPRYLMMIFTANGDLIEVGARGIRILSISILAVGAPMLIGAYYQAIGKKIMSLVLYVATMIFLIPCLFIFTKTVGGIESIWWAYVTANCITAVLTAVIIVINKNREKIKLRS